MSTDQTPALARAARELVDPGHNPGRYHLVVARAVVSAALHDPDHRGWLAEVMYREDYPESDRAWEDLNAVTHGWYNRRADAVRAAILGEA